MLRLKLILILLTTSFLNGCETFPTIKPQERCMIVLESDVGQYCRCHQYGWSKDFIGRIGDSYDKDIMYCNKLIGFSPDSSGEIYIWQEKIRLYLQRNTSNNP